MSKISLLCFSFLLIPLKVVCQSPEDYKSTAPGKTVFNDTTAFTALDVSYYGTTQHCVAYNIYAFKYKRSWMLSVIEGNKVTMLVTNPPKTKSTIHQASAYTIEGVAKSINHKYIFKKKGKRSVRDIDIYGFYKFNKYGKRTMKGLFLLEFPETKKEKKFFLTKLVKKIFGKDIKKAKDSAGMIRPNVKVNGAEIGTDDLPVEKPKTPQIPEK